MGWGWDRGGIGMVQHFKQSFDNVKSANSMDNVSSVYSVRNIHNASNDAAQHYSNLIQTVLIQWTTFNVTQS